MIEHSVGAGGANRRPDVVVVQILLTMNRSRCPDMPDVSVDGVGGPDTLAAIGAFQHAVLHSAAPDRCVDPDGATLRELRVGIPAPFSAEKVRGIMPVARPANVLKYFPHLEPRMRSYGIDTPLRQAHFLAQIGHESGSLQYCEEIADGSAYEHRADLGNTTTGDGKRFKGRGLIQLTGRANYKAYGSAIGRDLLNDDKWEVVADDPELAVDVACWFWKTKGLNALADDDDVRAVTKKINGGYNGLEDRQRYLARSRFFLGL